MPRYRAKIAGLVLLVALPAHADEERGLPFSLGPVDFTFTVDTATSFQSVQNAQHGIGTTSRSRERAGGRQWMEGFVKPTVGFEWQDTNAGEAYGKASVVATATRGAGEAGATSTTSDQPEYLALNDLYVGWRSGLLFGDVVAPNALDISVGNQEFTVGDGFLLTNGTLDGGGRAAYYLGPRNTFERTAILKLNTEPVRADLFHLESGVDQKRMRAADNPATKMYGANVEWFQSSENDEGRFDYAKRKWSVGVTYITVYDADHDFSFTGSQGGGVATANRDGLQSYSLRAGGSFIPGLEDLALYGEWARQRNTAGSNGGTVRAGAWYVQPQYTFSALPWKPMVTWRYAHFSGDSNGTDTVDRSWDPLYSDAGPRGGTTWTQGQIYSQYVGANTNLNSHYVGFEVEPLNEVLKVGLAYFRHDFDKPTQAGATSKHLMDEVDLYATWTTPVPGVALAPTLAMGRPGNGQKQALGATDANDRTIWLGQIIMTYAF